MEHLFDLVFISLHSFFNPHVGPGNTDTQINTGQSLCQDCILENTVPYQIYGTLFVQQCLTIKVSHHFDAYVFSNV